MTLDPYTPLPDLEEALAGSQFEEATECLQQIFDGAGIKTVEDLENSPRKLTCSVCMVSVHKLIQHLLAYIRDEIEQSGVNAVAEARALVGAADDEEE
jgi:hypothetical protein